MAQVPKRNEVAPEANPCAEKQVEGERQEEISCSG